MHIGLLQTGHAPDEVLDDIGDYDAMFRALLGDQGYRFTTYNVVDNLFPNGPQDADAWLITGSRHGAYEDHPWIPKLEALIRDIRDAQVPLIGVCFGHQIIAQALGGKVEKYKDGWAVGRQTYHTDDGELHLNAWHQDQVVQAPDGAQVFASNAFCANAGLMIGDRILTIQPHPEFGAAMIDALIQHRGAGTVPASLLERARKNLNEPVANARFAQRMARVLNKGKP